MACITAVKKKVAQMAANAQNEARIQDANDMLTNGTFKKMSDTARHFNVPYGTLRRRHLELAEPRSKAHIKEQLLMVAEEQTVCKWVKYMGLTGHPISKEALRVKVAEVSFIL
jgi:hypothetical protein